DPTPRVVLPSRIDVLSFDPTGQRLAANDSLVYLSSVSTQPELRVRSETSAGDLIAFDRAGRMRTIDFDFKGDSWPPKHSDIRLLTAEKDERLLSHERVTPSPSLPGLECVGLSSDWKLVDWDQEGKWLAMFSRAWWG